MVRKIFLLLLAVIVIPLIATGQDYSFSVDKNYSALYINSDGTCTINYEIKFTCDENAHSIDIVDIGMPNDYYDLESASAKIDNTSLTNIKHSEYVHPGIEVHLGSKTISPGESGTLLFAVNVRNMIFPDTKDSEYVSVVFSPTWYGGQFTHGTTELSLYIVFPPGVKSDEPKYHKVEFTEAGVDSAGRVWYNFHISDASPSRQYTFGVSFPREYIPDDAVVTETPQKAKRFSLGRIIGLLIGRLAGSCPCLIIGFFIFIAVISAINASKRKMKYLPPALSVEGVGVKRGLTAVESSILLELPLNKIATMILFGLIKKRVVKVKKKDPLRLEILEREKGKSELHKYEKEFLNAISKEGKVMDTKLRATFVGLIESVNKKTKGFSRKKTREYYRGILNRAWTEIRVADSPQLGSEALDRNLEWLMMDENYQDKMNDTFKDRTIIAPIWWGYYNPGFAGPAASAGPVSGVKPPAVSMPSLPGANFANSIVSGVEGFANKIVSSVTGLQTAVTRVTNPVPVSKSSSWSSSGGGCACACACAGCACACAGGGR
jgi:hypothetical protein